MSDPNPGLSDQDLQRVGDYVRGNLNSWLTEVAPQIFIGPQLLERMTRVEEQLKAQGQLMATRFEAIDKRFESVDKRFEAMDKRFGMFQWMIGAGFTALLVMMSIYEFIS